MGSYEVWDAAGANLAGEFGSEDEALRYVCDAIALNGRGSIKDLVLGRPDGDDNLIKGATLAKLALERFPPLRSAS